MRFLVIGAGAVGVTLGTAIEHTKNEVAYLVRRGRKASLEKILLVNARTGQTRKRERPVVFEMGSSLPPYENAMLCVRGDQVKDGLVTVREHVRPDATLYVAAASLDGMREVRAAHPGAPVVEIFPTFSAWSEEPGVWRWFQPPLVKTIVSGEAQPAAEEKAAELAPLLDAGGLPATHVPSARERLAALLAPGVAILGAWELAAWDLDRLGHDRALRTLAGRAMSEAARALADETRGPARLLAYAPAPAFALALRALPRLADDNARAMWRHHGPKIKDQTRAILDELLARPGASRFTALRELRERLAVLQPRTDLG